MGLVRKNLGPAGIKVALGVKQEIFFWLSQFSATRPQVTIRAAVSGGPDSLALAAGLAWCARREGFPSKVNVQAMVVDHGLQPGSAEAARQAAQVCKYLGLAAQVVKVSVSSTGQGLEAAARDARYAALVAGLSGSDLVLTGHNMQDQAETVLLGLARGSGTKAVSGMARRTTMLGVGLARPLLGISREEILAACEEWHLSPWIDPTNVSVEFTRNRVRSNVLPVLADQLGGQIISGLAKTAELVRADLDYLEQLAVNQMGQLLIHQVSLLADQPSDSGSQVSQPVPSGIQLPGISVAGLAELPLAQRARVVRLWANSFDLELNYSQTGQILALVDKWRGQGEVHLPFGCRILRFNATLWVRFERGR